MRVLFQKKPPATVEREPRAHTRPTCQPTCLQRTRQTPVSPPFRQLQGYLAPKKKPPPREREIVIDNLLVRVHWVIKMIVVERPYTMGMLNSRFPGSLISTFPLGPYGRVAGDLRGHHGC